MSYVKIDGQMQANGAFPLTDGSQVTGSPIIAANLTALQNYNTKISTMQTGMFGIAQDNNKVYQFTVIGNPPTTPHTLVEFAPTELTPDQLAAIQGANTPSASNVFATINDLSGALPVAYKESSNSTSDIYYSGLQITVAGQTALSVSHSPSSESVFLLWRNGMLQACHGSNSAQYNYSRTGTNITWNNLGPGGALDTDDEITVQYNATASGFDYNSTGNILVTTWTGPTASAPSTNIRLSMIGKTVSLYMEEWSATGDGSANYIDSVSGVIPSAYRPASTTYGSVATETTLASNSVDYALGRVIIQTDGSIIIKKNEASENFNPGSGKNFKFLQGPAISWILA